MLELLLIRHGQTDWNVGRKVMGMQPVGLNAHGRSQVERMAVALQPSALAAIYASPAQRTLESAEIVAQGRELAVVPHAAFSEVDYGDWINAPFHAFDQLPIFQQYLYAPQTTQIPGGENVCAMQARAVAGIEEIRVAHQDGRIAVVSHSDVIKAIIVHYVGAPLAHWQRYAVDNASCTVLRFSTHQPRLLALNAHPDWQERLSTLRDLY